MYPNSIRRIYTYVVIIIVSLSLLVSCKKYNSNLYNYYDISRIIINNQNATLPYINENLQEAIFLNDSSCFISSELYVDKINYNFDSYRLFNFLFLEKLLDNEELDKFYFNKNDLNNYINSDKFKIDFTNLLFICQFNDIYKDKNTLNFEDNNLVINYLIKQFDEDSGYFFANNEKKNIDDFDSLKSNIHTTNQALRLIQAFNIDITLFEKSLNKSIRQMENLLKNKKNNEDRLLKLSIIHNITLYINLNANYNTNYEENFYFEDFINQEELMMAFEENDNYYLSVLSAIDRIESLESLKLDNKLINKLFQEDNEGWKKLVALDIGLAYTKVQILKKLGFNIPEWTKKTIDNYENLVYSNIPYVNFEEQYYGSIILKTLDYSNHLFNEEKFISTCLRALDNDLNITNIFFLYRTLQNVDSRCDQEVELLKQNYKDLKLNNQQLNNDEKYYKLFLDIYLLGKDINNQNNFIIESFEFDELDIESTLYYYVISLVEQNKKLPTEKIQHISLNFFNEYGFSAIVHDEKKEYINIYSTYRMLELYYNGIIDLKEMELDKIGLYLEELKDDGLYYIVRNENVEDKLFTMKSICLGLGIEIILDNITSK